MVSGSGSGTSPKAYIKERTELINNTKNMQRSEKLTVILKKVGSTSLPRVFLT